MGQLVMKKSLDASGFEINMYELQARLKSLVNLNNAEIMRLAILSIIEEIDETHTNK